METVAHQHLKQLALGHLRDAGCLAVAMEVSCPIGRYRIDVAGYMDTVIDEDHGRPRRCAPQTFLIECKQARSDFLRDDVATQRLVEKRARFQRIRRSIEQHRIPAEEPELRIAGSSLFPEMDEWDFASSALPSYTKVVEKLERIDTSLHGHTKFHTLSRWRAADIMLLAAPQGLIRRAEVPPGWGLLECPPAWLDGDELPNGNGTNGNGNGLTMAVEPDALRASSAHRQRLLRNIAVNASLRSYGGNAHRQRRPKNVDHP